MGDNERRQNAAKNQVHSGRVQKSSAYRDKQKHLSRREKSQKFVSDEKKMIRKNEMKVKNMYAQLRQRENKSKHGSSATTSNSNIAVDNEPTSPDQTVSSEKIEKIKSVAGPFVKARVEFEKKQAEQEKKAEEIRKIEEENRRKLKEKQKKAVKLQMRTKRGQPIMANLMDVLLEKIERDSKK